MTFFFFYVKIFFIKEGFIMNLVERLRQEILELHLESEEEIIYHLYKRTGEIFDYNPRFDRLVELEKKALFDKQFAVLKKITLAKQKLLEKEINIENVEEFEILCTTWAKAFVKLLREFGINAEIMKSGILKHEFVLIKLKNGLEVFADLMIGIEDVSRMKLGMKPKYLFYENDLHEQIPFELKNKTECNESSIEEDLEQMKVKIDNEINQEISSLNIQNEVEKTKLAKEKRLYKAFKAIECIISTPRPNVRFASGSALIQNLLAYFLKERYLKCTEFYNLEDNIFILIYSLELNEEMIYFCYQETENGWYEFHEISQETIKEMQEEKEYEVSNNFYLKLEKLKSFSS